MKNLYVGERDWFKLLDDETNGGGYKIEELDNKLFIHFSDGSTLQIHL